MSTRVLTAPPDARGFALVLHGGAGGRLEELSLEVKADYDAALAAAYRSGEEVLAADGGALEAVCATVAALEDDPLFNAGRGAALTASGRAELDASVMTGDGAAGAVAASCWARNPVYAARAVIEHTDHILLVSPPASVLREWGLQTVDPEYFVTPSRLAQLHRVLAAREEAPRHGTVGAVAVDASGRIAAATSTGGMVGQADGRVGDTPIIGAGTFARQGVIGVSCTGQGEAFIRGAVAHDVAARIAYQQLEPRAAIEATIAAELTARGATGGVIAAGPAGVVCAHNSPAMFAAFRDGEQLVTLT